MKRQQQSGGSVVKNRAPAPIQISAEQIIREAADRQEKPLQAPIVKIHDAEEYRAHLATRRQDFEKNIRYRRDHVGTWVKYARFEEDAGELERSRSVFERALETVDSAQAAQLYLRYAEMELRNEMIQHARNILDRAVQILPRVDFLWYKYVWIEEMVGDIPKARAVFERWMQWMPADTAWISYARFETRHGHVDRAEEIWRRYCNAFPVATAFIKFAKWAEYEARNISLARTVLEAALTELPHGELEASVYQQFAALEERQGEYERARILYRHVMPLLKLGPHQNQSNQDAEDHLSESEKAQRQKLYQSYLNFEKKHGQQAHVEQAVWADRRQRYQSTLQNDPYDYDSWLDWAQLEEDIQVAASTALNGTAFPLTSPQAETVRDVFERAVAQVPPDATQKDHWRRYIYLWIFYAVYEELVNNNLDRATAVYQTCLDRIIPHKNFTFAKIWILASQVQLRKHDVTAARKIMGRALGTCQQYNLPASKLEKIFGEYIGMELALGEVDRCRTLYGHYIKALPTSCQAWSKFAELEQSLGETERCRALYELAIQQAALDQPEKLWKAYIDFEMEEGQGDRARDLYKRLLQKTTHVKVWISYAQFEASPVGLGEGEARRVFEQANEHLRTDAAKDERQEERVLLLDAWRVFEKSLLKNTLALADEDKTSVSRENLQSEVSRRVAAVEAKMPRRIKRRRMRLDDQGQALGWEEYFDYQFPEDHDSTTGGQDTSNHFKLLEMAALWKAKVAQTSEDLDSDEE